MSAALEELRQLVNRVHGPGIQLFRQRHAEKAERDLWQVWSPRNAAEIELGQATVPLGRVEPLSDLLVRYRVRASRPPIDGVASASGLG